MFELQAEFAPESWEGFGENPGREDDREDIAQPSAQASKAESVCFDLYYIAVFFAQRAVPK